MISRKINNCVFVNGKLDFILEVSLEEILTACVTFSLLFPSPLVIVGSCWPCL